MRALVGLQNALGRIAGPHPLQRVLQDALVRHVFVSARMAHSWFLHQHCYRYVEFRLAQLPLFSAQLRSSYTRSLAQCMGKTQM